MAVEYLNAEGLRVDGRRAREGTCARAAEGKESKERGGVGGSKRASPRRASPRLAHPPARLSLAQALLRNPA